MRSRLLMSAAVLVAGLAVASAQNAPGAGQEHTRHQARSQLHRSPAAAPRKAEQPPRSRATGFGFQDGMEKGRSERGTATRGKSASSMRPHSARGDLHPPAKHNDASVLPPRRQWDRGHWSMRDRAMGQGHLQPEQDRTRPGRRQQVSPPAQERGHQDLARNKSPRRLADQRMARAGNRDARGDQNPHDGHKQTRTLHREHHRDGAPNANTGLAQVRRAQTALNQQGFNVGDPDGKLGKRTKEALIAFQKQRGFRTTGNVDRTTLHALLAGGAAAGGSMGSNQGSTPPNPAPAPQPNPAPAAIQSAPQGVPPPATTGRSDAAPEPVAPPQPTDGETPPASEGRQMPDSGASGRVPAGSPQEDYKDETAQPTAGDRR
jgi:peptidoglycan hydrolase-like protein with peptidoglycan-binding domain